MNTKTPLTADTAKKEVIDILMKRLKDAFGNEYHKYEYKKLLGAIYTIEQLVPPDYFSKQPTSVNIPSDDGAYKSPIVEEAWDFIKRTALVKGKNLEGDTFSCQQVIRALNKMDERLESLNNKGVDAVGFVNWILKNGWILSESEKQWQRNEKYVGIKYREYATTSELMSLYIEQLNKTK